MDWDCLVLRYGGWCLVGRRLMTDDTVRGHSCSIVCDPVSVLPTAAVSCPTCRSTY